MVICNAPSWFHSVWSMVARVLPDSVRKKVIIMNGVKGLDEFINPTHRPEEYGGTDVPLGQAPEHLQFLQLAKDWELIRTERGEKGEKGDIHNSSECGSQSGSGSGSGYHSSRSSRNSSIQGKSKGGDYEKESNSNHRKKSSKKKKSSSNSSSSSSSLPVTGTGTSTQVM